MASGGASGVTIGQGSRKRKRSESDDLDVITSDVKRRAKDDDNKGSGSEHFAERGEEIMETGESKEMNKKNIHDEKNEDSRPNDKITEKLDYVFGIAC